MESKQAYTETVRPYTIGLKKLAAAVAKVNGAPFLEVMGVVVFVEKWSETCNRQQRQEEEMRYGTTMHPSSHSCFSCWFSLNPLWGLFSASKFLRTPSESSSAFSSPVDA